MGGLIEAGKRESAHAPEQHYAIGCWVNRYVNSSFTENVFTGSLARANKMFDVAQIPNSTEYTIFYVVNMYNLQLPDSPGKKLNVSTLVALNQGFNRLYNNGAINLFEPPSLALNILRKART